MSISGRAAVVTVILAGIASAQGVTTRVSIDSAGGQANGTSGCPSISGDGGDVAFESSSTNLVPGDTNGVIDVIDAMPMRRAEMLRQRGR